MKKFKKERRVNLMKKTKLFVFFMLLGIGICFLLPLKATAQTPDGNAEDWYNYITNVNHGRATATIERIHSWSYNFFAIIIEETPDNEFEGYILQYNVWNDLITYFEPRLQDVISLWWDDGFIYSFEYYFNSEIGEPFSGFLYWNFFENYWQIDYFELTEEDYLRQELEYYKQRVLVLEDLVTNLSNQLNSRNIQIQKLNGEINTLLNEIQQLENALESEYDRGYTDGVSATESEAYEQGFRDGQKSKLAENNEKFYNGIEKWLVPAIITVIALGGFVTIAARKRREE